jgi:hypothetical protein
VLKQWFILYVASAIFGSIAAYKYIGALLSSSLAYFLISGAFLFGSPYHQFNGTIYSIAAGSGALLCFTAITALLVSSVAIDRHIFVTKQDLPLWIAFLTFINASWVVIAAMLNYKLVGNVGYTGIIENTSTNGALIAAGAPCAFKYLKKWIVAPLILAAIFLSKASIPYGVLIVSVCSYLVCVKKYRYFVFLPAVLAVGRIAEGANLFADSGRFLGYEVFWNDFVDRGHWLFGNGLGSFFFLGPKAQCDAGLYAKYVDGVCANGDFFVWAHSDWFQIFYENGIIGFLLVVACFISVTTKLFKLQTEESFLVLSCFLGLCACGIFNFPIRDAIPALLICLATLYAQQKSQSRHPNQQEEAKSSY